MTRREFGMVGVALLVPGGGHRAKGAGKDDQYRPQVHYAPTVGFMNDPNGLLFYQGEYHLFYQYNPFAPKAGNVHWGHAVSADGLHWRRLPVAIKETPQGQAFSGSAVVDKGNTSGLFRDADGGIVAVYTRAGKANQAQAIAASYDRGRTFTEYPGNPVLDVGSDSFRDPKVFRHAPSNRWIMAVVRSREHRVVFYGSLDLKDWKELSSFGHAGILGIDYECPDLVSVPVEGGGTKWVLFVSINPGAPQGGSTVQYFVGDFDGTRFTPDDTATRFADFGKDFYALQTFNDAPGDAPLAIAWMSNWQYCNDLPTGNWRGVMSLPRRLGLRRVADDWHLVQTPLPLERFTRRPISVKVTPKPRGEQWSVGIPSGAAIEGKMTLQVAANSVTLLQLYNRDNEFLNIGYDAAAAQLFLDRAGCRGFSHHLLTDKCAVALAPGTRELDLHFVADRCTLEVFAQNYQYSGSLLHFPAKPFTRFRVLGSHPVTAFDTTLYTLQGSAHLRTGNDRD